MFLALFLIKMHGYFNYVQIVILESLLLNKRSFLSLKCQIFE